MILNWQHERRLWHKHFIPSVIAGLVVAAIALFFELTAANAILFASVGASAMILSHTQSHHLIKLRASIIAYTAMIVIAIIIREANVFLPVPDPLNIFLSVTLVGLAIILLDAFHPPAVSASLSFVLFELPLASLIWLFIAVIILLVTVRFLTYTISERLPLKEFVQEFKKTF